MHLSRKYLILYGTLPVSGKLDVIFAFNVEAVLFKLLKYKDPFPLTTFTKPYLNMDGLKLYKDLPDVVN